ncbi:expressed protein [Phakopsora pachyrhizi]|nr:expressed protein [Phakopsora pachyrhizi]
MVFQAVWVLVLRISAKNFSLGSITRNNVIKPHPGNCFAIICILAFPFTMYCSIFQLGIRSLKTLDGYPIVVAFPCSFFWLSAWLFFWSWYGTVICNRWDPPWTQLSTIHTGRVPLWVIISLNLSIILGSLGCLGGYFGTATVLDRKMRKATKFVHQVIEQFLAESPKYDTAKWQESQFVQMMLLLIPIEHSFVSTFEYKYLSSTA